MSKIKKGIYQHYKGKKYRVLGLGHLHSNQEELVVYEALGDGKLWLRPYSEFVEKIPLKDGKKHRFQFLSKEEDGFSKSEDDKAWEDKYKRALADYHNLLKQSAQEKQDFIKYSLSDILTDILPIYDHLKLSLSGLKEEEADNAWVVGVKHVLKEFKDVLKARGVEEIKTKQEKFDHNTMEALAGSGDHVKQEIMPGYKLNGRVIRPAKVIVE